MKDSNQRVVFFFILPLIFLSICLLSCSSMFAQSLIYANRQPIIKNPQDYGMNFEKIEFLTPDSITLKGWYIAGNSNSIGIITHPMNFSKYGYSVKNQGQFKITDVEVEFLTTAKALNDQGHSVLMFDLRNHGESDYSQDSIFSLGLTEWQDIVGALNFIEQDDRLNTKNLFFVSFCTGANSTIIAMSKMPNTFANVKCLIAIQPISTSVFVNAFMHDKYSLLTGMIPKIEKKCIEMGGYPFEKLSPENYVSDIFLPVLYVQAESDRWTDVDFVKTLYQKTPEPKELLMLEGEMHRFDTYNYFGQHPDKLLSFIDKYISP